MTDKWIPVSKQMPEPGIGVLITDGRRVTAAQWWKSGKRWDGHEFAGYEWEFDFDTREVTHWMPLPEPPSNES